MLLSKGQAYDLGLIKRVPLGYCASCGKEPAAPGKMLCHTCRAACDLYEQPTLEEGEDE